MTVHARHLGVVLLLGALLAGAPAARAWDDPPPAPPAALPDTELPGTELPGTELPPYESASDTREVPDYDGLPPRRSPGDALRWIPRVLFFPLHVLFEYVLRRPIGALLTAAEKNQWQALLYDFFTFGEGRDVGLVPTFFFDFGVQPSVGVYFFANDVGGSGHDLRVIGGFGGLDWYRATVVDRVRPLEGVELALEGSFWDRPDQLFHGIGWDADRDARTRFEERRLEALGRLVVSGWRKSRVRVELGVAHREFENSDFRGEPSVSEGVQRGLIDAAPPGFRNGYTAYHQRLTLELDTRRERPDPQHGLRLAGSVEQGLDLAGPLDRRWVKLAGTAGAYVDAGRHRAVGLTVFAGAIDPLDGETPPFTELFTAGLDPLLLGGFLPGYLRDDSLFVATFEYRYPIWVLLDGSFHFSVGNVFDGWFDDFRAERLRMSFGVALRGGDRDNTFTLALAFGTDPFSEGANVESVRFVLGTSPL